LQSGQHVRQSSINRSDVGTCLLQASTHPFHGQSQGANFLLQANILGTVSDVSARVRPLLHPTFVAQQADGRHGRVGRYIVLSGQLTVCG
jgi:hypothetical protein